MRNAFHAQLNHLNEQLVAMSDKVDHALATASHALQAPDLALAERVIAGDLSIDSLRDSLDEQVVELLACQAPVASDLRVVVTALRAAGLLERMGDLAGHMAKLVRLRFPDRVVAEPVEDLISDMLQTCGRMASKTCRLIHTKDVRLCTDLELEDDKLDVTYKYLIGRVQDDSCDLSATDRVDMMLLARYLERFGDHSVVLSRRVRFMVEGSTPERDSVGSHFAL